MQEFKIFSFSNTKQVIALSFIGIQLPNYVNGNEVQLKSTWVIETIKSPLCNEETLHSTCDYL